VYDVVYLDSTSRSKPLATALGRDSAVALARTEARRRRVGRMFLAGSERPRAGEVVVIVESQQRAA
jgi:hypothetical protein